MGYTPQTPWEDFPSTATPTSAARLNHMEEGIESVDDDLDAHKITANHLGGLLYLWANYR
jgi:hypothetical protein